MYRVWLFGLTAAILLVTPPAFASVVINEALFDPSGTDTGLEKIELYNPTMEVINMAGWELYPDGIGYFAFPSGFTLQSKSFVVVHLRMAGTNDTSNLYHSGVTGNMGNSSGSIALFSASSHPADSIADFVRYNKAGSSERKTWESAASDVGLWTTGQFVDITDLSEGNSISLTYDGARDGVSGWRVGNATVGSLNSPAVEDGGITTGFSSPASSTPPASQLLFAPSPPPSLKAYAGEDREVFQGSMIEFRGRADGINGEPLTSGRFSWNFGDGMTKEGKIVSHIYYFPGVYNVSIIVSSGEYTGAGYLKVTVVRPGLVISEAKTGERGFIELFNNTDYRLDLGGFILKDGTKTFAIERDTYISHKSALVFSNAVTGLLTSGRQLSLNDAHDFMIDSADVSSPLFLEESFERVSIGERKFIKTKFSTPGTYIPAGESGMAPEKQAVTEQPGMTKRNDSADNDYSGKTDSIESEPRIVDADTSPDIIPESTQKEIAASAASSNFSSFWFMAASIIIGFFSAAAFLLFRRT